MVVCAGYWIFGADYSGGETEFQRVLSLVYLPGLYLLSPILLFGWAGAGLLQLAFPVAGAALYSFVLAAVVYAAKRGHLSPVFDLSRSGT